MRIEWSTRPSTRKPTMWSSSRRSENLETAGPLLQKSFMMRSHSAHNVAPQMDRSLSREVFLQQRADSATHVDRKTPGGPLTDLAE